jgi:hypothetical protein
MLKATLGTRTTLGVISFSSFPVCHPNDEGDNATLVEVGVINHILSSKYISYFVVDPLML